MFLALFAAFCLSRRPTIGKYVKFAHPSPRIYDDSIGCTMCQAVIEYIDKLLKDEKVESEIIELAGQLCNNFQDPYSTLCHSLVSDYVPTIISWIDQGITTSGICEKFGFCPTTLKKRAARFPGRITLPKTKVYQNSIGCDLCKNVVDYIAKLFKDQTIEEEIAALVEKLCDTFPSPYSNICDSLVEQYLPIIIQWIQQGLESANICQTIGLCQATLRKAVRIPQPIQLPSNYNNGIGCGLCTKLVLYVEELLKDQKIEEEIATLAAQLCKQFPSPYSTICDTLVEQYIPMIIEWIEKGIEAADICNKLGLCENQKSRNKREPIRAFRGKIALPSPRIYDNSLGCDMCTKVVQYIEQLMKDEKVEEEIAQLVAQLCQNFPAPYDTLCSTLVESFIPLIMKWIETGMESIDICTKIGLCTETQQQHFKAMKLTAIQTLSKVNTVSNQLNDEVACEECKKWYSWVQTKFHDITIEGLWKFISEDCPSIPYLKYFCEIINEDNIHKIFDLIVAATPPEKACVWINLCPAAE